MDNTQLINNISNKVDEIHRKIYENVTTTTEGSVDLSDTNTKIMSVKSVTNTIKTDTENLIESANEIISANATANENINSVITKVDTINEIAQNINTSNTNILQTESEVKTDTTDILEILTEMQNKVDSLQNNIEALNENDVTILNSLNNEEITLPFEEDPFKLDEEFTGYDNAETYYDYDYIECTKPFYFNENEMRTALVLAPLHVICDDESFKIKLTLSAETFVENVSINIQLYNSTIPSANSNTKYNTLELGNSILTCEINDAVTVSSGNKINIICGTAGTLIKNYKVEFFGKNIRILNKKPHFNIFCKNNECYISKVIEHDGYIQECKTTELNPYNLNNNCYKKVVENVDEINYIQSAYTAFGSTIPAYKHLIYNKTDNCIQGGFIGGETTKKISGFNNPIHIQSVPYFAGNVSYYTMTYAMGEIGYDTYFFYTYGKLNYLTGRTFFNFDSNNIANFTIVEDCYRFNEANEMPPLIITHRDGTNSFYTTFSNSAISIEIGFGFNVTAYFSKEDKNRIYVYMKVGDKMIKKTIVFIDIEDENGNITRSPELIEERIIGTYDKYFSTSTDIYFIEKDAQIYMYKN